MHYIPLIFSPKKVTFFSLFLGLLQAQMGVNKWSEHLLPAYSGREKRSICLLLYYAASNKNAEGALELKINHNLKH